MKLATRKTRLLNSVVALAIFSLAGQYKVLGQVHGLDNDGDVSGNPFAPPVVRATLPLTIGWFDGEPCLYTSTEASDPGVAAAFNANYAPH